MKRKNFLLSVIVAACMTAGSSHAQTEILFNGSDLSNWNFVVADGNTPAEDVFSVQDILLEGADLAEYKQPAGEERPKFPVVKKRADSNEKPVGEWNRAKIDVKNGVIKVYINDLLQNTGTSNVKEGYLGLQSEGGLIQFRTVKVTPAG